MDHYQYLGVGRSASPNQIEAAARLALWRYGADAELTERIMDAWSIVGDPDRRFDYDFWLLTHPSPEGVLAPVERGAAPQRMPEPDVLRAPGQRHVSGPLQPERVSDDVPLTRSTEPLFPASPASAGSHPTPSSGVPLAAASTGRLAQSNAVQPSWWEECLKHSESVGPGFDLPRLLVLLGMMATTLGLVANFVALLVAATPSTGILLACCMGGLGLVLIGRLLPRPASRRIVKQRVFGIGGGALSRGGNRFGKENTAKGVIGERRTALALESLLHIPGTRIFHGLRFPGSRVADIDHAVVNGDRVVFIDSKNWKPGEYRWLEADKLGYVRGSRVDRRDIHMDHLQRDPATAKVAAEVVCHVLIHPNESGTIRFTPGGQVSPTGIPATGVQDGIEMIGQWLLQGQKCGLVDRYVMARMIAMLK